MKAIILAAGKGERLVEITKQTPKPMIKYNGKPILQYNIEMCKKYGVDEIYINLHHLAEMITEYFGNGEKFGVTVKYSYEDKLLGTSGAVKKISKEFWSSEVSNSPGLPALNSQSPSVSESFFVLYGDQFSEFNLNLLIKKYNENDCIASIAFHYREDVSHSGIAEFDVDGRIERFIEKPKEGESDSHWVNAGIYYLNPRILEYIPEGFSDFGRQIFPKLLKKNLPLYGVCERKEVKIFDTPEMYKKNIRT
ncbi:MAG: nucleotidyltransferase family protein [Melioribacteraceae bacterium]